MKKAPMIHSLASLINSADTATEINGQWVAARPIGYYSLRHRLHCAWLAFTGKCDLVRWPGGQ